MYSRKLGISVSDLMLHLCSTHTTALLEAYSQDL